MNELGELSVETLLAPINGGSGEDLTFSLLFDEIKEARRADPDYLPQGEWQTELKQADWGLVIRLAGQALAEQSKDIQLAGWLCEGLAHREGFAGIRFGLHLTGRLLDEYWESLYPEFDEDDLEERSARLSWLSDTLTSVVRTLPLVAGEGYGLADYEESRQVENQARNDPDAMGTALREGKINDEIFQRSVVLSSTEFLKDRHANIVEALTGLHQLESICDQKLGHDAPSYGALQKVMEQCRDLTERLLRDRGASFTSESAETPLDAPIAMSEAGVAAPVNEAISTSVGHGPADSLRKHPQSRDEAFEMLNGVARYFKEREPHSPVPYLVERAIKWGRMPLEEWLKDVIKDDGVIDNIRDTLGTQQRDDD
ncbi:type VI secretion system protein ImpA [Kushneria avicenniae]|uniref:Type VI secretion system protein ImpA n=1 Tax=Kushneria avicenniae TaxID=402385 RepID=A0A1I1KMA5_9GAMM|nr:type VI secretion system protein TssA [Kushneria avicenniae]SFC58550.1 type VI secretion system protein ImpA [Kushneria avicenniae]